MANEGAVRFTWHELMTSDAPGAVKFYAGLFGWTVEEMSMGPMGTYRMFKKGDRTVAGGMQAPPGVPSHWLAYAGVPSADATVAKVKELGGKVVVPPTDVPNMVRFAVTADPQGAHLGVVQPLGPQPTPPNDATPAIGTFCWDELLTKDLAAAKTYYAALFGWTGHESEGAMKYWHWKSAGADIGGMMALPMPNVPPHWLSYIAVSDVDASTAKTKELGGKVMMPPMEIEKVGKFSVVQDPAGATFSLFRSARV